jgi:hypothetical protein
MALIRDGAIITQVAQKALPLGPALVTSFFQAWERFLARQQEVPSAQSSTLIIPAAM